MSNQRRPRLSISEFGPIKSGEIELRPLTVFIGPNNSGKSYAALLAYALSQSLSAGLYQPISRLSRGYSAARFRFSVPPPDLDEIRTARFGDLPAEIQNESYVRLDNIREYHERALLESFHDYFGTAAMSDLIRTGGAGFLGVDVGELSVSPLTVSVHADARIESATLHMPARTTIADIPVPTLGSLTQIIGSNEISMLNRVYADMILDHLISGLGLAPDAAYYLPSARSGILQGWTILASLAVQTVRRRVGLDRIEVAPFSGVAGDFLELLLENLTPPRHRLRNPEILAPALRVLESSILGGDIQVADPSSSSRPAISYVTGERRLPLQRTSSMVAELAPLDLWLKYLVEPGDLLVIDEPEAHLHPENQRHIARVLVRLVRAGVRIICPTHSSLILHQLSNHLLATTADEAARIELGYTSNDLLQHDDIGVYLFDLTDDGTVVSPVPIDPEFGIAEDEFVRVSEAIGDESYRLTSAMALP